MAELKKIIIYKIKENIEFDGFLKEFPVYYDQMVDMDDCEIYIKYDNYQSPIKTNEDIPWISFLNSGFDDVKYHYSAKNNYPRAIVGLKIYNDNGTKSFFAITFGQHGDTFLEKEHIIYDFGIKVGMNICDLEKLKKVQTSIYESVAHQTERQLSVASGLSEFGINNEAEFLRMISGNVKHEFIDIVESFKGKENIALKLPGALTWERLVEICQIFDERYGSDEYKNTEFRVYDILRHEADPQVIFKLDKILCEKIVSNDFDKIYLAPPEFIKNDDISYCYKKDNPELYDDLRIEELVSNHRISKDNFNVSSIKRWDIFNYNHEHDKAYKIWNGYQCIIAELSLEGKTYILANSQWREISEELKEIVINYFETHNIVNDMDNLPENINIYDKDKKQNREEVYNSHVAQNSNEVFLFDKAKISVAGEKRYEICDLLFKSKQIIHVKRYSSGSASISHLFAQGRMYSHAFSTDDKCRKEMRAWIDAQSRSNSIEKKPEEFKAIIPEKSSNINESEYTVIFCILYNTDNFQIADLPFMAQFELMNAHKYLTQDRKFKSVITFKRVVLGPQV